MVTIRTTSSNMKKLSILHTDYMCFFRFLDLTAIISLHIIKWFVFVVRTLNVFHEIQALYLNISYLKFLLRIVKFKTWFYATEGSVVKWGDTTGSSWCSRVDCNNSCIYLVRTIPGANSTPRAQIRTLPLQYYYRQEAKIYEAVWSFLVTSVFVPSFMKTHHSV